MSELSRLIDQYAEGPKLLRDAVAGMTAEQLKARPVAGKWSTLEVVAHIADAEPLYADRIKRIVAENEPVLFKIDPDQFVARLAYDRRDVETELALITALRAHMVPILRSLPPSDFQRIGRHSEDGPLTLETILQRIANHIPHHLPFIAEKRQALGA